MGLARSPPELGVHQSLARESPKGRQSCYKEIAFRLVVAAALVWNQREGWRINGGMRALWEEQDMELSVHLCLPSPSCQQDNYSSSGWLSMTSPCHKTPSKIFVAVNKALQGFLLTFTRAACQNSSVQLVNGSL